MSTELQNSQSKLTAKALFNSEQVQKKFNELLGKRASAFITSVLQVITNNDLLSKADPMSIYHAATVAATLDLPINQNLGFAYIVPYNSKNGCQAQFQMGYKGFIQLAQRSGQFKKMSSCEIYEGQIKEANPLSGYVFDFNKKDSDKVIGYAAYFQLTNGFETTLYMTIEQLSKHGTKYSQSFKKGFGLWKDDFDSMAKKTVLKLLLSKFAPLSIEMMQKAVIVDQSIINNADATEVTYIDNSEDKPDKELERATLLIKEATDTDELKSIWDSIGDDLRTQLNDLQIERYEELSK